MFLEMKWHLRCVSILISFLAWNCWDFHYELLWEFCNGKCRHLCSSAFHILSWYLGVNLCEGVLIIGYVEWVHWLYQPNRIRNHEHGFIGPQYLLCATLFLDVQRKCQWRWGEEECIWSACHCTVDTHKSHPVEGQDFSQSGTVWLWL